MDFSFEIYNNTEEKLWDNFVKNKSVNGTFLQTRKFLNYHPKERFEDCSVLVFKGNELVAVIPACNKKEENRKLFVSHQGATYGGLVISKNIYNATAMDSFFNQLESFLRENEYNEIIFRQTPNLFSNSSTDLIEYMMYKHNYSMIEELNYYLNLEEYQENIVQQFSRSKRRDYRYSLNNNFVFQLLDDRDSIAKFYEVLLINQKKLGVRCVHTLDELIEFQTERLKDIVKFYGVYKGDEIIAGSMAFIFNNEVFHTQYLAFDDRYSKEYPMDFLVYNLIVEAVQMKMKKLTFGICTEDNGKYLNLGLSRFKEGFGTTYAINKTYIKNI